MNNILLIALVLNTLPSCVKIQAADEGVTASSLLWGHLTIDLLPEVKPVPWTAIEKSVLTKPGTKQLCTPYTYNIASNASLDLIEVRKEHYCKLANYVYKKYQIMRTTFNSTQKEFEFVGQMEQSIKGMMYYDVPGNPDAMRTSKRNILILLQNSKGYATNPESPEGIYVRINECKPWDTYIFVTGTVFDLIKKYEAYEQKNARSPFELSQFFTAKLF